MSNQEEKLHDKLIEKARQWLVRNGHSVVVTDMAHAGSETPDAIGWKQKNSTLVECKATRSDFLADRKKFFRKIPKQGMGLHRYYLAPEGLLKPEEIPESWGLLELTPKGAVRKKVKAGWFADRNLVDGELSILLSALRRVAHTAPPGVSVKCYTIETKNRATLTVEESEKPS